jgi:hypothetical protein
VEGVGDVCAFAMFDIAQHGDSNLTRPFGVTPTQ